MRQLISFSPSAGVRPSRFKVTTAFETKVMWYSSVGLAVFSDLVRAERSIVEPSCISMLLKSSERGVSFPKTLKKFGAAGAENSSSRKIMSPTLESTKQLNFPVKSNVAFCERTSLLTNEMMPWFSTTLIVPLTTSVLSSRNTASGPICTKSVWPPRSILLSAWPALIMPSEPWALKYESAVRVRSASCVWLMVGEVPVLATVPPASVMGFR